LGLLFTWASGWFEVQQTRIQVENEKLQLDSTKLTIEKEQLTEDHSNLVVQTQIQKKHLSDIENDAQSLRIDKATLSNEVVQLQLDRDQLRSAKEHFESEARRLAGADTNAIKYLDDLTKIQRERDELSQEVQILLETTNENMRIFYRKHGQWILPAYNPFSPKNLTDWMPVYHKIMNDEPIAHDWFVAAPWKIRAAEGLTNSNVNDIDILPPGAVVLEGTMYCMFDTPPSLVPIFPPTGLLTIRTPLVIWREKTPSPIDLSRSHTVSDFISAYSEPLSDFTTVHSNQPAIGFRPKFPAD